MKKSKKNKLLKITVFVFILFLLIVSNQANFRKSLAGKFLSYGNYYFNGGEYDLTKAKSRYKLALFFDSDFPQAHYQLGRIYFVEGNFSEARNQIDTELALYPDNLRSYYVRGLIDGYSTDFEAAIDDFTKFVAWAPREWAGYNDLAWAYYKAGDFQKSKETALEGLKLFPNNAWLLNGLGVAELSLGNFSESQKTMDKVSILADNLRVSDWIRAYPGNNPADAEYNLEIFKENIGSNFSLAKNKIAFGGIFADACGSTRYSCSGISCVAKVCDEHHENCTSSCSSNANCFECTPGEWDAANCRGCDGGVWGPSCSHWGPNSATWCACEAKCEVPYNPYDSGCASPPGCTPSCGGWSVCPAPCNGTGTITRTCTAANCSTYAESRGCMGEPCVCTPNCKTQSCADTCIGLSCIDSCGRNTTCTGQKTCGVWCGRCSTVTPTTFVSWYDGNGGCDDDWYNQRTEYACDYRCVDTSCAADTCVGYYCNNGCVPGTKNCTPPCFPKICDGTCYGSCWDGCYQWINCPAPPCTPANPGCATNTCIGSLCWDGCEWKAGEKDCAQDGDCGNAVNKAYCQKPTGNVLCSDGTATNVVADGNRWKWTCEGSGGGGFETCYALKSCAYQEVSPN